MSPGKDIQERVKQARGGLRRELYHEASPAQNVQAAETAFHRKISLVSGLQKEVRQPLIYGERLDKDIPWQLPDIAGRRLKAHQKAAAALEKEEKKTGRAFAEGEQAFATAQKAFDERWAALPGNAEGRKQHGGK